MLDETMKRGRWLHVGDGGVFWPEDKEYALDVGLKMSSCGRVSLWWSIYHC